MLLLLIAWFFQSKYSVSRNDICKGGKLQITNGEHRIFERFEACTISNLSQMSPIADICYVSNILTVRSKSVISFLNKGKSISPGLPFFAFL